jgi:hypothetical protein
LSGGTEKTLRFCIEQQRAHRLIDASKTPVEEAAGSIANFVRENEIHTLNVAGPRRTEWPHGYEYAYCALDAFLDAL